ncbi:MAG TPA: MBL fold metallo-hydrolase [Dehalococcoidia bacterium]|nr:MBL fold metallo-hydrolase [Dehalococcoidia bacterium]
MSVLQFGDIRVSTASDGHLLLGLNGFFPDAPPDAFRDYAAGVVGDKLRCELTTYVIESAGRTLLVDTGLGSFLGRFEGACGVLPAQLDAAGIEPERVDAVVFTHLHPDHVGWNCTERHGAFVPTFPNARYIVHRPEWERWKDVEAGYIRRHVLPLAASSQLDLVDDGHEPAPGVRLLSTPGHTAGHVSVLVHGGGEGGVITGDAAHHPLEIEHPDWSPSADDDRVLSARSRTALVERIEAEGLLVLGGHFPAPHAGRVVRVEQRRVYRPLAS